MFLTRFAKKWWAAPALLPVLLVDGVYMVNNEGASCDVAQFFDRLFPEPACCRIPPYANVAIWADGDARVIGDNKYLTTKPARSDLPVGWVAAHWGHSVSGFLAPCQTEDGFLVQNFDGTLFPGVVVTSAVAVALEDAGCPLPTAVRCSLRSEGISTATSFVWWGAVHDLLVVPPWVVTLGAVGYQLAASGRWVVRRTAPPWVCVKCWYDLRGLPEGALCPECGRALSKAA